jgi:general secretion pathway protein K
MSPPSRRAESGLALVTVLGIIVLLSLLATSVLEMTRRHGQLIRRSMEAGQALEVADSAIRLTLRDLLVDMRRERGRLAQAPQERVVLGKSVILSIQPEAGRVDVNFADRDLLFATLAANGLPQAVASVLTSRILDWRDPDDVAGTDGGERADYARAGRFGPRNAPFESVAELSLVLGFDQVPASLLNAFTVHAHRQTVRRADAVPAVERALRWADQKALSGKGASIENGNEQSGAPSQSLAGESLRVIACTRVAPRRCRESIARLTGSSAMPVQILSWQSTDAE